MICFGLAMRQKAFAVVLFILSSLSIAGVQAQRKSDIVRIIEFNDADLGAVLANLGNDYDVAIGLEADPDKPRSQISLHLQKVVFPQILDGIVQTEPRYRWRENNGSIDVLPVSGSLN